ncbi:hypothetical protein A0H81_01996 [Grifola frondosa]|uniref:Uncharacterized protein n=1 Tax=Grifola frondosa TaxID=5627 RepID=A0A1C7MMQ7_GRIFR|nr:hypothetical protein A0H81_01996 [Grifola frondosa]
MNVSPNLHRDPTPFPANDRFFFNFIDQKVFELIRRGNGPYADWFLNVDEDRRAAADILEGQEPRIAEEDVPTIDCYVAFATAAAMSRRVWLIPVGSPVPSQPDLPPKPHRRRERSSLGMGASIHPHAEPLYRSRRTSGARRSFNTTHSNAGPPERCQRLGTDSPSIILAHSSGSSDVFLNPEDAANAPIPRLFQRHAEEPDF